MRKFCNSITAVLSFSIILCACDGNSKMRGMNNTELASKRDECIRNNPTAPGKATACENIRKECERRRKEGNYSC